MIALWALLALLFLFGAGYYSGAEMGLYSLNRLRLRLQADRAGDPRAALLLRLSDQRDESVLAVLLMQNIMNYLLAVATIMLIAQATGAPEARADVYAAAILSPIVFVFGDVVPKNWFRSDANRLMYATANLVNVGVLAIKYTGVIWLLKTLSGWLTRISGQEEGTLWRSARGEIIGLLRETAATGTLSEEQSRMIERVMNLSNIRLGNIMVTRQSAVTLPWNAGRQTLESTIRQHDYSRLPVLSADHRNVAGIVNVYDVLSDDSGGSVMHWMRPALTIPASTSAMQALLMLRQGRQAMGIVTDPRRGFVGIVTLKDLVEEIFGELAAW